MQNAIMKMLLSSLCAFACCTLCAAGDATSESFSRFKSGDKASGWTPNLSFRKNDGMGQLNASGEGEERHLRFLTGEKQVFHLQGPYHPVKPGEVALISAMVRGKGSFRMSGYVYNSEKRWLINIFPPSVKIDSGDYQEKSFRIAIPTQELRNRGLAANICPVIVIDKASQIDVKSVSMKILPPEMPVTKDVSGFDPTFHAQYPGLNYAGQPLFTGIEFSFDTEQWTRMEKILPGLFSLRSENGYNYAVLKRKYDNGLSYDIEIRWNKMQADISMEYTIPADSPIVNVGCEFRFARRLFELGAPEYLRLNKKQTARPAPEKLSLNTYLGRLDGECTESGETPPCVRWQLRSTFHQFWRQEDQKTYGLLYLYNRPAGKKATRRFKASFRFSPHPTPVESQRAFAISSLADKGILAFSDAEGRQLRRIMRGECSQDEANRSIEGITPRIRKMMNDYTSDYFKTSEKPVIIPQPKELAWQEGRMPLSGQTAILVAPKPSTKILRAAELLRDEIRDATGFKPEILRGFDIPAGKNGIRIGLVTDAALSDAAKSLGVTADKPGPQGYGLLADSGSVTVIGCDEDGAFFGMWSVVELIYGKHGDKAIPAVRIRDWPSIRKRALGMDPHVQVTADFIKLSMKQVAARHKANELFFGPSQQMGYIRWKSHPEIALDKRAWTIEQIRDMVDYAKSLNLKVIPMARAFGKVPNVFKVYPQWKEGNTGNANAFCLSNPEIRPFLASLYDEIIDIWKPDAICIPFDEIDPIGTCPKCRGTSPEELVYNHMMWVYNYFKSRGIRLIICQDMLLEKGRWQSTTPSNSAAENGHRYRAKVHPVLDRLPKDIIIHDWNYTDTGNYPELPYFKKKGFTLMTSCWCAPYNCYYLARDTEKNGIDQFAVNSFNFLNCRSISALSLLGFEYAWNTGSPKPEELQYRSDRRMHELLFGKVAVDSIFKELNYGPVPSAKTAPEKMVTLPLGNYANRTMRDDVCGDGKGWFDLGPMHDMRFFSPGKKMLDGLPFEIASKDGEAVCVGVAGRKMKQSGLPPAVDGIAVNQKVKSLIFLHTSNFLDEKLVAHYVITYSDGTKYVINLLERQAILPWERPAAFRNFYEKIMYSGYSFGTRRVWVGLNLVGNEVDLQAFEWVNPHPDKEVASIRLAADGDPEGILLLLAITAVK